MKSRRTWWIIYGLCVAAVIAALLWITVVMLRLEAAERAARGEMEHQESLRLALWRMDSWLAPHLAREAARPYFEYLPYYPQERAYTRLLNAVEPGEILMPSPLLAFDSEILLVHFQLTEGGSITSPQVPTGNLRDLAEATGLSAAAIDAKAARLHRIESALQDVDLGARLGEAESLWADYAGEPGPVTAVVAAPERGPAEMRQQRKAITERSARARSYEQAQQQVIDQWAMNMAFLPLDPGERSEVFVGRFAPMWLGDGVDAASALLVLARRVRTPDSRCVQGILLSWPDLQAGLLAEIEDLFPRARLVPAVDVDPAAERSSRVLAAIPVALEAAAPSGVVAEGFSAARMTLALVWLAAMIAAVAVAATLRASVAYGERRSRFASAVTHELRTPLTTFRMYSEMLAEGMVRDEAQRRRYLRTLKVESGRLATLVENVLAYSRLEEGRAALQRRGVTVRELIDFVMPQLSQRTDEAKMRVVLRLPDDLADAVLETDRNAVAQILFNLVDNACKYAARASNRHIDLLGRRDGHHAAISVCDHGPGIDPAFADDLFVAFRRAEQGSGEAVPGVGLGLALARGLARDLGGDLALDADADLLTNDPGACFTLRLPIASER